METLDRITVDPKVCMGQPTVRGTRITVPFVVKLVASGMTNADILRAYPELVEEDIAQALRYAAWASSDRTRPAPLRGS